MEGEIFFISAKNNGTAEKVASKLREHTETISVHVNKFSVTWTVKRTGLDSIVDQMIKDKLVDTYTNSGLI